MTAAISILEVLASEDGVSTRLTPTGLSTEDYGRILAGLAADIASMMAAEGGFPADQAYAQILNAMGESIEPPSRRGAANATAAH